MNNLLELGVYDVNTDEQVARYYYVTQVMFIQMKDLEIMGYDCWEYREKDNFNGNTMFFQIQMAINNPTKEEPEIATFPCKKYYLSYIN